MIRKISHKKMKDPDFFTSAMLFMVELVVIAVIIFLATLPITLSIDITTLFIVVRGFGYIGWSFPPAFPIYFNLAYSLSLIRLMNQ
jgi:hypothetical protein